MKKSKMVDEIKILRKQGKSYNEIARIFNISSGVAYRHGKAVKIEEKPDALVLSERSMKAYTRAFMMSLIWDTAELLGYGRRKKYKFKYNLKDKNALRLREYEELIRETDGFIMSEYFGALQCCLNLYKRKILKLKKRKK